MLSMLRIRVLGLVLVVPRLALRECPRFIDVTNCSFGVALADGDGDGDDDVEALDDDGEATAALRPIAASRSSARPFNGVRSSCLSADGLHAPVAGFDRIALPASDSTSTNSGGRRSFSMSDLRLHGERKNVEDQYG